MNTQLYNRTYNVPLSFDDILKIVKSMSIQDKLKVERELENETLLFRAKKLDTKVKKNTLNMNDIVAEIEEYRIEKNGK
ncbi:MAG: hypothetical protein JW729_04185 [Bacteroidales bacterium]|nr:hypothetical protein [Bacteroidales bacterium]